MKLRRKFLAIVLVLLMSILYLVDYIGLVFACSMLVSAVIGFGFGMKAALVYFSIAWKVYLGLAVLTYAFLMTFYYQNCCVGLQSFSGHLKNHKWHGGQSVVDAALWPYSWFMLNRFLNSWGMVLGFAFVDAVVYWVHGRRHGIEVAIQDPYSGVGKVVRVKNPDELREVMEDVLRKDISRED